MDPVDDNLTTYYQHSDAQPSSLRRRIRLPGVDAFAFLEWKRRAEDNIYLVYVSP